MDKQTLDAHVNKAAYQLFRDVADGDYIMARSAFFSHLAPQFFTLAQQAIEKYLKCIHVLHRENTKKLGHDLYKSMNKALLYDGIQLSSRAKNFIHEINTVHVRYFQDSYFMYGAECAFLDATIWELRRYCVRLEHIEKNDYAFLKLDMNLPEAVENVVLNKVTGYDFELPDGKLEKIAQDIQSQSYAQLTYENAFYGHARKTKVLGTTFYGENMLLHVVNEPELYDELNKYMQLPQKKDYFDALKLNNIVASQKIEFKEHDEGECTIKAVELRQKLTPKVFPHESEVSWELHKKYIY